MSEWRSRTGTLVHVARANKGLTQRGLTEALGLSEKNRTAVAHIEQGRLLPSPSMRLSLSEVLNIPEKALYVFIDEDRIDPFLKLRRRRTYSSDQSEEENLAYEKISILRAAHMQALNEEVDSIL